MAHANIPCSGSSDNSSSTSGTSASDANHSPISIEVAKDPRTLVKTRVSVSSKGSECGLASIAFCSAYCRWMRNRDTKIAVSLSHIGQ